MKKEIENKINSMCKEVFEKLEPLKQSLNTINESLAPILIKLKPNEEVIKKLAEISDIVKRLIPKDLDKKLSAYKQNTEQVYKITASHQWFFNRLILNDNGIKIENEILKNNADDETFDRLITNSYEKIIDLLFDSMESVEIRVNIKEFLQEIKQLYKEKRYYSCISSCQPIIELNIQRLNNNQKIFRSDKIRKKIEECFVNEIQPFDMISNSVYTLFKDYYYCDDEDYKKYVNCKIPNRHCIAHGFSFDFVCQKGALNMIILLSILYDHADYMDLII